MGAHTLGRRVRSLLVQAALWAPTMGEEDAILEALQEQPDRAKVKAQVTQEKSSSCTFISWQESQREKEVPQEPRAVLPSEAEEKVPPPEVRPELPRCSVIKENLTRRAALGPSHAGCTDSVSHRNSIRGDTNSNFSRRTWGHQWRSIQVSVQDRVAEAPAPHQSDYRTNFCGQDQKEPERFSTSALLKACTTESSPLRWTLTPWTEACSAEAAICFEPVDSLEPAVKDKKLAHPASQCKLTKKGHASPLAFSSGSHRRISQQRGGQASVEKQKHRSERKRTRRSRRRPRRTSDRYERKTCSNTIEESSSSD